MNPRVPGDWNATHPPPWRPGESTNAWATRIGLLEMECDLCVHQYTYWVIYANKMTWDEIAAVMDTWRQHLQDHNQEKETS